jgi:hypothetical protein
LDYFITQPGVPVKIVRPIKFLAKFEKWYILEEALKTPVWFFEAPNTFLKRLL